MEPKPCRLCKVGRVAPSNARRSNYVCGKCRYHKAGGKAIQQRYFRSEKGHRVKRTTVAKYRQTAKGQEATLRINRLRVTIGGQVVYMKTVEQAAYIRQRRAAFTEGQEPMC